MSLDRTIEFYNQDIVVEQDFSGELGGTVWDASLVLVKHFEHDVENYALHHFKNKSVLELGAGTGLVSIALALMGADVYCTDLKELIPLMKKNFSRNNVSDSNAFALPWGDVVEVCDDNQENVEKEKKSSSVDEAKEIQTFDYIILADCIAHCYSDDYSKLFETLEHSSNSETTLLIAYELRDARDKLFFDKLKTKFKIKRIEDKRLHEDFRGKKNI